MSRRMKLGLRIVLWTGAGLLTAVGLLFMSGVFETSGTDAAGRGLSQAYGLIIAMIGGAAVLALVLARFWRGFFVVVACLLALPFVLMIAITAAKSFDEARNERFTAGLHNGRYNFGDQPALLAVAEAIAKNDPDAIRAAAKSVPDLNAAGRDDMTLLYFAVNEAVERPQVVSAVETLLSLGADPNYTNGSVNSFVLAQAMNGEVRLLRVLLDGGGNANARDIHERPIVFDNWENANRRAESTERFRLLLDRGMDVNATSPANEDFSILMQCAHLGRFDPGCDSDALELLERGADFNYRTRDGMTVMKLLMKQREEFEQQHEQPSPEFEKLWSSLKDHSAAQR